MLNLVKEIYPQYVGHSFVSAPDTENDRIKCVQQLVQSMMSKMGIDIGKRKLALFIEEDPFCVNPKYEYQTDMEYLNIPPLLLFDPNEAPAQFKFNGPNDPKLNDDKIIQDFANWICRKLDLPKKRITNRDKQAIRLYFKFMQNPEKAKHAIPFILGHELSHFSNDDGLKGMLIDFLSRLGGIAFSFVLSVVLVIVFSLSSPAALIFFLTTAFVSYHAIYKVGFCHFFRLQERKADEMSVTKLPGVSEGAIYLFETLRDFQKEMRNQKSLSLKDRILHRIMIKSNGDNRICKFTHFTETQRIKHIQKVMEAAQKNRRNLNCVHLNSYMVQLF
ncbi:MAG TPA: M48 family metalloprotease [Rhabdochlamydiaceae bacterium]|nr:M48 family metalloprotease [Rhabdochlamydiaceae bacterium]